MSIQIEKVEKTKRKPVTPYVDPPYDAVQIRQMGIHLHAQNDSPGEQDLSSLNEKTLESQTIVLGVGLDVSVS